MSDYRGDQQRRREAVDELLTNDPTRSDRAIARIAGVHHCTVRRRRVALEQAGKLDVAARQPALGAPPLGNERAMRSGQATRRRLEPLKAEHLDRLRTLYPAESEHELALCASRMARLDLIEAYLDQRGLFKRHEIRSEVAALAALEVSIERTLVRFGERARSGNGGAGGLSEILAGLQPAETGTG